MPSTTLDLSLRRTASADNLHALRWGTLCDQPIVTAARVPTEDL